MTLKVTEDLLDKTTPVDDDKFPMSDSADLAEASAESGKLKRLSWANVKTTLQTFFDTIYWDMDSATYDPATIAEQLVGTTATQTITNKTIDVDNNTVSNIETDNIKSTAKTGLDTTLFTGTKGAAEESMKMNADWDLVSANIDAANLFLSSDTGVQKGWAIEVAPDTTKFRLLAGNWHILDNETDSDNPTITEVSWIQQDIVPLNLATQTNGWVYIDSAWVTQQQNTDLTATQRRANIFVWRWTTADNINVTVAQPTPDIAISKGQSANDMFRAIGIINDGVVLSPNGANLNIDRTTWLLEAIWINWGVSNTAPNTVSISALSPVNVIRYGTQTGITDVAAGSLIKPADYDVWGVVTTIPWGTNVSTNQRVYQFPSGNIGIWYGQETYSSLSDAVANVGKESWVADPLQDEAVLIATISVIRTATNLSDTAQARIILASKFGEASSGSSWVSVGTLQTAYNNTTNPEILTDVAGWAVDFQRGTAADTDNVVAFKNGAGTVTSSVTWAWVVDGTDITKAGVNVPSISETATLTNKTIDLTDNTITWTTAEFNTALSDGSFVTLTGTETLTNKRITERTNTISSSATPTPAWDTTDVFTVTALAAAATFAAPTGTPTNGQVLLIRIKDNWTARVLAWNAIYNASTDLPLPLTTVLSKTMYLQFVYNSTDSKWTLLGLLDNI